MEHHPKILLVDDESHIRKYLGIILKKIGSPTVIEAVNGADALTQYDQHQPDLVIMDVNMPMMDGLEALRLLLIRHPAARVVMLTSMATRQVVYRSLDLGAVDFLRKDISREAIDETLAGIIRVHVLEPAAELAASSRIDNPNAGPQGSDQDLLMMGAPQPMEAAG
jgi:two-component system, chemotaxis family, chemotaxis protein CheY